MKTLYYGGVIHTLSGAGDVEALLVEDGRICAVGELREFDALCCHRVNLQGGALLPAFIDAHSHFTAVANSFLQLSLEGAADFAQIQARLRAFVKENDVQPGQWVFANGYDHNALREGRHPPREVLDAALARNPVVISHASGHMGTFNSCALERLGVTETTPAPEGGLIEVQDGRLTGYMEENAFISFLRKAPMPGKREMLAAYRRAQEVYLRNGIVTVQEGLLARQMLPLYRALLDADALKVDLVAYAEPDAYEEARAAFPGCEAGYVRSFRLGGVKIFLDGSPQARTAWVTQPYLGGTGQERGYPSMKDEQVADALRAATRAGAQLLAHCNGDAAAEQFLRAVAQVEREQLRLRSLRPVMIHAQLLRRQQLARLAELGVIASFFIAHIYHWGEVHVRNLGRDRAAVISPAGSALRERLTFTFHQDAPVIAPDMLETLFCACVRQSRAGEILGADERIAAVDALRAVTCNAAYQYFEEGEKGDLAPGKRADLLILSADPLAVAPERLRETRVLQTLRAGETLYRA